MAIEEEFVALVSHQLGTPLISIAGHVESPQDRTDPPAGSPGQLEPHPPARPEHQSSAG